MEKSIRWRRVSYRAGAILDLLAAIQMIIPAAFAATSGISDFHPGREYLDSAVRTQRVVPGQLF
jgi:hypothetical protein